MKPRNFQLSAVFLLLLASGLVSPVPAQAVTTADCTIFAVADEETIGTDGNDIICGTSGNDVINSGAGADTIFAGSGADTIFAASGADTIYGEGGADIIDSGTESDTVYGGNGPDVINTDAGNDFIDAGDGDDDILAGVGHDRIFGGAGNDIIEGEGGNEIIDGGLGVDAMRGGTGINNCVATSGDQLEDCISDTKGPQLVGVTVDSETQQINTWENGAVVKIRAQVKDVAAGSKKIELRFRRVASGDFLTPEFVTTFTEGVDPECGVGGAAIPTAENPSTACRVSGDSLAGTYEFKIYIRRYTAKAKFQLSYFTALDNNSSKTVLVTKQLINAGLTANFSQIGRGDAVAPDLDSIELSPSEIDTNGSGQVVSLLMNLNETGSGLTDVNLQFAKYANKKFVNPVLKIDWTDELDFCWYGEATTPTRDEPVTGCVRDDYMLDLRFWVPRFTATGNYRLQSLTAIDRAANSLVMDSAALVKAGLVASFDQLGVGDAKASVLKTVNIYNTTVDTSVESEVVRVEVQVTDDLSGLDELTLLFNDAANATVITATWSTETDACTAGAANAPTNNNRVTACRISGDRKDGVYQFKLYIPVGTTPGVYHLQKVSGQDLAGNPFAVKYANLVSRLLEAEYTVIA